MSLSTNSVFCIRQQLLSVGKLVLQIRCWTFCWEWAPIFSSSSFNPRLFQNFPPSYPRCFIPYPSVARNLPWDHYSSSTKTLYVRVHERRLSWIWNLKFEVSSTSLNSSSSSWFNRSNIKTLYKTILDSTLTAKYFWSHRVFEVIPDAFKPLDGNAFLRYRVHLVMKVSWIPLQLFATFTFLQSLMKHPNFASE